MGLRPIYTARRIEVEIENEDTDAAYQILKQRMDKALAEDPDLDPSYCDIHRKGNVMVGLIWERGFDGPTAA